MPSARSSRARAIIIAPCADARFARAQEAARGDDVVDVAGQVHLRHHPANAIGREKLPGPFVGKFEVVKEASENVGHIVFESAGQGGKHFRELVQLGALIDLHVFGFSGGGVGEINGIAEADRRHGDEIAENLKRVVPAG
ncbi:MAG: hypothetical protein R3D52_05735 [Xanthobacteraceae bacterium]